MPLVQITLTEGRTPEQLAALGAAVTAAVHEATGAPRETVRVVVTECPSELWFVGGESLAARRASPPAPQRPSPLATPGSKCIH